MKTITILDNLKHSNWNLDEQILSRLKFWVKSDVGTVPEFVNITQDYIKDMDIDYNISAFNNIDKSSPWLIFVAVNFPFTVNLNNQEQLENTQLFQGMPDDVLNELVNGNAYLILSFEQEAYTTQFFDLFYALYRKNPLIPANKLIHLTAAYNIHEIYEKYCLTNNITEQEKIQIWYSCHSLLGPIKYHVDTFFSPAATVKEKKFINFNRAPRSHRVAFTSLLAEYDLLDYGYVSLGIWEDTKFQNTNSVIDYVANELSAFHGNNIELQKLTESGSKKLVNALPLTIDTDNFVYKPSFGYSGSLMDFYNKSYFSIVSNTYFFDKDEMGVTVNEKEYKAILARHPFLLVAKAGTLGLLKNLGFKTFDQWFDESYDDESDDAIRMLKLIKEVDRLCKIDNNTWDKMIIEMTPTLEYNYDRVVNHANEIIFNSTDFKHILEYAT